METASKGAVTTLLSGWGANVRASCRYLEPETPRQVAAWLDRAGTIARGLGRSYGDVALNDGAQVLGMSKVARYLGFDERSGTLTCEAGVTLAQIIQDFARRGWFPLITPGTKLVTIGGCIANDVHGKAHHAQGSFSECVESMRMLLANGETVTASRQENAELFWGTFGGLGLLGIVIEATLRLRPIETTYFRQKAVRVESLEGMLTVLDEGDRAFQYSVGSIDVFASGARLGRGVVAFGDHAALTDLPPRLATRPLRTSGGPKLSVPFELPDLTLNRWTIRLVNAVVQYVQASASPVTHYEGFLYPLDVIANWNRGYGRRGFAQYQFVIPLQDGVRHMRAILQAILSAGELPFLNVLKRLGRPSGGLLSFAREGYTFAIDFPVRQHTVALLRRLDAMVLEAGGRVYLGKDSYLQAPLFRAMYPSADRWLVLKAKYDPHGVFTSNMARRLGLG